MGGSKSKATQTITNNTVNKNYLNTLNEKMMEVGINTLVENANACSSAVTQNNECSVGNISGVKKLVIGGSQSNVAKVNFSCVSETQAANDMSVSMISKLTSELQAMNGTSAGTDLNAALSASTKSGFGGYGSSSAKSNQNVTNNVTNETIQNITNTFKSKLNNNFTSKTVSECIGKTTQTNKQKIGDVTDVEEAEISCIQTNSLEQIQTCKAMSSAINKSMNEAVEDLGLKVEAENITTSETKVKTEVKSETVTTGPIEELGNAVSGILGAIGLAFLGPVLPFIMICCCILCCCIILGVGGSMLSGSSGGSSGSSSGISSDFSSDISPSTMPTNLSGFKMPSNLSGLKMPSNLSGFKMRGGSDTIFSSDLLGSDSFITDSLFGKK
jgi:hypothetical protein